jgi:hypothetical protein
MRLTTSHTNASTAVSLFLCLVLKLAMLLPTQAPAQVSNSEPNGFAWAIGSWEIDLRQSLDLLRKEKHEALQRFTELAEVDKDELAKMSNRFSISVPELPGIVVVTLMDDSNESHKYPIHVSGNGRNSQRIEGEFDSGSFVCKFVEDGIIRVDLSGNGMFESLPLIFRRSSKKEVSLLTPISVGRSAETAGLALSDQMQFSHEGNTLQIGGSNPIFYSFETGTFVEVARGSAVEENLQKSRISGIVDAPLKNRRQLLKDRFDHTVFLKDSFAFIGTVYSEYKPLPLTGSQPVKSFKENVFDRNDWVVISRENGKNLLSYEIDPSAGGKHRVVLSDLDLMTQREFSAESEFRFGVRESAVGGQSPVICFALDNSLALFSFDDSGNSSRSNIKNHEATGLKCFVNRDKWLLFDTARGLKFYDLRKNEFARVRHEIDASYHYSIDRSGTRFASLKYVDGKYSILISDITSEELDVIFDSGLSGIWFSSEPKFNLSPDGKRLAVAETSGSGNRIHLYSFIDLQPAESPNQSPHGNEEGPTEVENSGVLSRN